MLRSRRHDMSCMLKAGMSRSWPRLSMGVSLVYVTLVLCLVGVDAEAIAREAEEAEEADRFSVVVLPDTQVYAQDTSLSKYIEGDIDWIIQNADDRDIVFVTHVGDVVNTVTVRDEFERMDAVFDLLDDAGVPYGIAPGNHDLLPVIDPAPFDTWFGLARMDGHDWFGSAMPGAENRIGYSEIELEGHQLLFIHLRWLSGVVDDVSQDDALGWVDEVLADHPGHLAFITTHSYTSTSGLALEPALTEVIQANCNVAMVFSGHVGGVGHGTVSDDCGRVVPHILTNYQTHRDGGEGYMRIIEIDADTLAARSEVYSPTLDKYRTGPAERFDFRIEPLTDTFSVGDVNCDHEINLLDAMLLLRFLSDRESGEATCPSSAGSSVNTKLVDVNADGLIDPTDVTALLDCVVAGCGAAVCPTGQLGCQSF